ncbi:MAG: copper homeostasis protein CutC [Asticcacaulis sp.]|nr:copper homeostasis protein CutC [Asticcacaulis sp.]
MIRVRLEVCVDTREGLEIAALHGADRIELCTCLSAGGLTPSLGIMEIAAKLGCPTRVMIRPRDGDFTYSPGEIDLMLRDIDTVAALSLEGVVFGANRAAGDLDGPALTRLVGHAKAQGLKVTLHRSFDLAPDLGAALAVAVDLGIDAVLTSGGESDAYKGINALKTLAASAKAAGDAIEIMAGVGVGSGSVREIVARTGVPWVHGSCSLPRTVVSQEALRLGYSSPDHRRTDPEEISRILDILTDIGDPGQVSLVKATPGVARG